MLGFDHRVSTLNYFHDNYYYVTTFIVLITGILSFMIQKRQDIEALILIS